jgi:hypothetical protein
MSLKPLALISSVKLVSSGLANLSRTPNVLSGRRSIKWYVAFTSNAFQVTNTLQREKNNSRRRDNGNANGGYDNNYSQQPQASSNSYGMGGAPAAQPAAPAANPAGGAAADPYAVYGGYQNYLAMWYASIAQQQPQGQPPQPGS